jgi:hypothetical protein
MKYKALKTHATLNSRKIFSIGLRDVHIESKKGFLNVQSYKHYSKIFLNAKNDFVSIKKQDPVFLELNLEFDLTSIVDIKLKY